MFDKYQGQDTCLTYRRGGAGQAIPSSSPWSLYPCQAELLPEDLHCSHPPGPALGSFRGQIPTSKEIPGQDLRSTVLRQTQVRPWKLRGLITGVWQVAELPYLTANQGRQIQFTATELRKTKVGGGSPFIRISFSNMFLSTCPKSGAIFSPKNSHASRENDNNEGVKHWG